MVLTKEQENQVRMQLEKHNRDTLETEIILDEKNNISLKLIIERGVFGSDIMSSGMHLTRFLYEHKNFFKDKNTLDMGCGPGAQGLVMAIYGAKYVDLSDISEKAVENTKKNIKKHLLENAQVYLGDLFSEISKEKKYDVIVFNHPFFSEEPEEFEGDPNQDEMLRRSMLGGTKLLQRFFREAPQYLKENGIIIMPYFQLAGPENDPKNHFKKYGLKIINEYKIDSEQGLQIGDVSIYIISRD